VPAFIYKTRGEAFLIPSYMLIIINWNSSLRKTRIAQRNLMTEIRDNGLSYKLTLICARQIRRAVYGNKAAEWRNWFR